MVELTTNNSNVVSQVVIMPVKININQVYSFRPNEYDAGVLESISESHPEMPDVATLLRKALRDYEIGRKDGGGTKSSVGKIFSAVNEIMAMVRSIASDLNYLKAKIAGCESLEDR